nr:apolipoprotein N-acyltransferase [Arsenicicoccus dermatophilus]
MWLSWPAHDLWFLAPVGIALVALATRGAGVARGLGLGVLAGLAAYLPALHWSGIYVGNLPWVALALLEASYVGLTGAACGALGLRAPRGWRMPYAVVVAAAWCAGEWLRSVTPFGGFPWLKIAFAMADAPTLPLVRYVATPGLTFVVALAGGLLAAGLLGARRAVRHPGARSPLALARPAGALAGAGAVLWGPALLTAPTGGTSVDVLAVQGNVPRAGLDFNAERRQVLDNHAEVTRRAVAAQVAAGRGEPALVVWPENASDIDPVANADAGQVITAASVAANAPILVGTLRQGPHDEIKNTTLLWEGSKGPTAHYAKRHPVPFAEYIPYRSFFRHFSDKVDLLTHDFAAGDEVGVITAPTSRGPVPVGIGICFESAYDDLMRDAVTHGGQILAVQTNNATFGYTDESYQQLAISRVRAVELGRSVVHVSTVGTSALITPDGVAHQRTALFTPAALRDTLPRRTEITPAVRVNDLAVWLSMVIMALGAIARTAQPRTTSTTSSDSPERSDHHAHPGPDPDVQRA